MKTNIRIGAGNAVQIPSPEKRNESEQKKMQITTAQN
jgi:hypothetical protein